MVELAGADAYLRIGVPMENSLLPRIERGLPELRIFDLREGIELQPDHGHHSHQHGETDPHIWLSPRLAAVIADNVAAALINLDPEQRTAYTENLARLQADLNSVDTDISAQLAPLRGRSLFVVHPAFGYFAGDYGLVQVAIQQGGLAPGVRHLTEVLEAVRQEGAGALFVQPQFSTAAARNLAAETGLELVVLDPLARDYLLNLRAMATAISSALDPSGANR
jgi:zinc transport system substrate-binding protein